MLIEIFWRCAMHIVPRPGLIDLEQNVTTASHLIVPSNKIESDESENEFKLLFEHFKKENRSCRTLWQKKQQIWGRSTGECGGDCLVERKLMPGQLHKATFCCSILTTTAFRVRNSRWIVWIDHCQWWSLDSLKLSQYLNSNSESVWLDQVLYFFYFRHSCRQWTPKTLSIAKSNAKNFAFNNARLKSQCEFRRWGYELHLLKIMKWRKLLFESLFELAKLFLLLKAAFN